MSRFFLFLCLIEVFVAPASVDLNAIKTIFEDFGYSPVCVTSALASCENSPQEDASATTTSPFLSQIESHKNIPDSLALIADSLALIANKISDSASLNSLASVADKKLPRNCLEIRHSGDAVSGVRTIYPLYHSENHSIEVYCDQSTDGGGWTVIQRRDALPIRENFFRNWTDYVNGFGNLRGEFWLGLDNIHALTSYIPMEIRIDLEDYKSVKRWAKYNKFIVGDSSSKYTLVVGGYHGNSGDDLQYQNGMKFSTHDQDNDPDGRSCAFIRRGAWWHKNGCHDANLNGYQYVGQTSSWGEGINWNLFHKYHYSLKQTSMKVRPTSTF